VRIPMDALLQRQVRDVAASRDAVLDFVTNAVAGAST
jgi:hypothetical protein